MQEKLNKLLKETSILIKKGSRKEALIMTNVMLIESLEYKLNIDKENRISSKRLFYAYL